LYILDIFPAVSETFILNEILELERRGYDITIFARRKEDSAPHGIFKDLKAKVVYLPNAHNVKTATAIYNNIVMLLSHPVRYMKTFTFAMKNRDKGLLWFFKMACVYANTARKYKFEHIHAHFASMASCYAMFISRLSGKPFTFTVHGIHDLYIAPPADLKERSVFAKSVITISEYNKRYLMEKFSIPAEKIIVIHCGIDLNYFSPRPSAQSPKPDYAILSVARLHPVKGLSTLINACAKLKDEKIDFRCGIIGEGEERGKLESMIESLGLNNTVLLPGSKPLEEIRELYKKAMVFALPSSQETMGVATMEAMASGVPVISTNIYGIPELIDHEVNGFLITPGDDKRLAGYLKKILTDECKRDEMGKLGRKKIEQDFNLSKEVDRLAKIWFEYE